MRKIFCTLAFFISFVCLFCSNSIPIEIELRKSYYYEQLNHKEKEFYDKICDSIHYRDYNIAFDNDLNHYSIEKVFRAVINEQPILFWSTDYSHLISNESLILTNTNLPGIIELTYTNYPINLELSDREKLEHLFRYAVRNWKYDEENKDQTMVSINQKKSGVCASISRNFQFLCKQNNIECIIVENETHAWNMVKIGNEWFHLDVTNSLRTRHAGDNTDYGIDYSYFCLTESQMKKKQIINRDLLQIPNSSSESMNFFRNNNLIIKSSQSESDIEQILKKSIEIADQETYVPRIKFNDAETYYSLRHKVINIMRGMYSYTDVDTNNELYILSFLCDNTKS